MRCQEKEFVLIFEYAKMITMLREQLNNMLQAIMDKDPKKTLYQIAKEAKTNYANLKDAFEGKRGFSDTQLQEITSLGIFPVSYDQLRAWKKLDDASDDEKAAIFAELLGEDKFFALIDNEIKKRGLLTKE